MSIKQMQYLEKELNVLEMFIILLGIAVFVVIAIMIYSLYEQDQFNQQIADYLNNHHSYDNNISISSQMSPIPNTALDGVIEPSNHNYSIFMNVTKPESVR